MEEPERVRPARPEDEAAIRAMLGKDRVTSFVLAEFLVLEVNGRVVGCGAVRNVTEGGSELAHFETLPGHRGRGLSRSLLASLVVNARRPVYTLTLPSVLATYAGFSPVEVDRLPASLQARARRLTEKRRTWKAMRLSGTESALLRIPADPDFPEEW